MKILVSACLLGQPVRYDGQDNRNKVRQWQATLNQWHQENRLIPICPESLGGLPTPRPPAEIQHGTGRQVIAETATVITRTGDDVTAAFIAGAERTLAIAQSHQVGAALLAARSPSCGSDGIYDGSFSGQLTAGIGVTVAVLERAGIPCFSPETFPELLLLNC